ncbi:MAG: FtsW/RodA/SpoVE family cell cycle protein [Lachnospiraceae bacterium]
MGGATRWIRVGGVLQFQPSDVVKILMIAFLPSFFQNMKKISAASKRS